MSSNRPIRPVLCLLVRSWCLWSTGMWSGSRFQRYFLCPKKQFWFYLKLSNLKFDKIYIKT